MRKTDSSESVWRRVVRLWSLIALIVCILALGTYFLLLRPRIDFLTRKDFVRHMARPDLRTAQSELEELYAKTGALPPSGWVPSFRPQTTFQYVKMSPEEYLLFCPEGLSDGDTTASLAQEGRKGIGVGSRLFHYVIFGSTTGWATRNKP